MSQEHHQEVREILHEADESTRSLLESGEPGSLFETAERASAFLESTDPADVLKAVDLGTLPDGSEPESIPEAIAQADEDQLEELRRLLHLDNLSDGDNDSLEAAATVVRESTESVPVEDDERAEADSRAEAEKPDEEGEDETTGDQPDEKQGVVDSVTETVTETVTDDSEDGREPLESAIQSSVTAFSNDIEQLRGRLEEATGRSDVDEGRDDSSEAELNADEEPTDEDEGLLEGDFGDDDRESTSKGVVRHSTVAPSPSDRADMRGTTRHSTMPDK